MLGVQQTPIDLPTKLLQKRQIGDVLVDAEVLGIVDGGLSSQGSLFLEVLLDVRALVVGM